MSEARVLLEAAGVDPAGVQRHVQLALAEDLPGGVDVTSDATIPGDHRCSIDFRARQSGVIAGIPVALMVFEQVSGGEVRVELHAEDGDVVGAGQLILKAHGSTRDILRAERPALNYLSLLSGIATATNAWVQALAGTHAQVRDTRKTTPGLRELEKYAVRCGGGLNHRMSLSDAALVKDNHVAAAGGVVEAFSRVREKYPEVPLEIEVDSIAEFAEMLDTDVDLIMLDNFSIEQMREAVALAGGRVSIEASGGLTLANAREVGETGVDFIAVGALTHSSPILDIGADYTSAE